jgi:hypothetical protein
MITLCIRFIANLTRGHTRHITKPMHLIMIKC